MTTLKGYPGQKKEERTSNQYQTINPLVSDRYGADVVSFSAVQEIGTDAAEASSTTILINAASHAAKIGDIIRMTSGATSGETAVVYSVSTNAITLAQPLSAAPAALDTFSILRFRFPVVDSSGGLVTAPASSAPIEFSLNGSSQVVTEDTGTPANNVPLPVKIVNTLGDVAPATEATVATLATEATLATLDGKVTAVDTGNVTVTASVLPTGAATDATLAILDGKVTAVDTGNVTVAASALPTGAATETTLATLDGKVTAVDTGNVTVAASVLPTGAATETTLATLDGKVTAVDTGAVTIVSSTLPTGAATETTLSTLNGKVTACDTGAVVLAAGTATVGSVDINHLDVVDFIDTTPLLDTSSTNIPASASTPVTIVASLAAAVKKIQFMDTTGAYIGLYSDPAGSPVLECIIGPGSDSTIEVAIPAATVLGLRNMENAAISSGMIAINFIG
jgi:hypothetical protein